ncbi:uncharacterized protein LOC110849398 isoform X2 [Folsomia candida]|uniref:uncharacterized protein LOC110849398 isoform X2 n=1 Tax=Folsomia candida TaxID=158441 RepID=UPI001604E62F|nr:uncharacterized protein LOC110849398 isoform X2 [Folsomia candida]
MIEFTVEKVLEGVKASALFVACLVLIYQFFGAYATLKVSSVLIFYYFIPQPKLFATLAAFWILLPFLRRSIQAHSLYQTYEGYVPCEEIRGKLKPWDLIEFERPTKRIETSNWGTDTVYHWVNTPGSKVAKINTDSLKDAADGANCRINNLEKFAKFHNLTRREDSEIYATIVSYLRLSKSGTLKYNELTENCEHFATFCIFGKRISIQADVIYEFYSANFYTGFVEIFIIYMGIYYACKLDWVQNNVLRSEILTNFLLNHVIPTLEKIAKFSEENEYLFIFILVVSITPIVLWVWSLVEE